MVRPVAQGGVLEEARVSSVFMSANKLFLVLIDMRTNLLMNIAVFSVMKAWEAVTKNLGTVKRHCQLEFHSFPGEWH